MQASLGWRLLDERELERPRLALAICKRDPREQQGAQRRSARWLSSKGKRHLWTNCTRRSSPSAVAFPAKRRGCGDAGEMLKGSGVWNTSSNDVVAPLILKATDTGNMRNSMSRAFTCASSGIDTSTSSLVCVHLRPPSPTPLGAAWSSRSCIRWKNSSPTVVVGLVPAERCSNHDVSSARPIVSAASRSASIVAARRAGVLVSRRFLYVR